MLAEYFASSEVQVAEALFWIFGDVTRAGPRELVIMTIPSGLIIIYAVMRWMDLDLITIDDDIAMTTGVNVGRVRTAILILGSLSVAAIVSSVGVIGFLGLIAPHIARLVTRETHRSLIPASVCIGATLLIAADLIGRRIIHPNIIPVGVIIPIIGAPILIMLLLRGTRIW